MTPWSYFKPQPNASRVIYRKSRLEASSFVTTAFSLGPNLCIPVPKPFTRVTARVVSRLVAVLAIPERSNLGGSAVGSDAWECCSLAGAGGKIGEIALLRLPLR